MNLRNGIDAALALLIIIILAVLLPLVIVSIWVFLWIIEIPNNLGKQLDIEEKYRYFLYRIVDRKDIEHFRDEYMAVIHPVIEYREGIEKWGLRREIDIHRERAIKVYNKENKLLSS